MKLFTYKFVLIIAVLLALFSFSVLSCKNPQEVPQEQNTEQGSGTPSEPGTSPDPNLAEEGFVPVAGATYKEGADDLNPSSVVFFKEDYTHKGREIVIRDLYVCDHEVTQAEYTTYCIYGDFILEDGDNYPVYDVSWFDAIAYCNLRSVAKGLTPCYSINGSTDVSTWDGVRSIDGKYCGPKDEAHAINQTWDSVVFDRNANGYRLPTDAEWEYVARGGSEWKEFIHSGSNDWEDVGWLGESYGDGVHPVKQKAANTLGLYDMTGNVEEWCYDRFKNPLNSWTPDTGPTSPDDAPQRVLRGGTYCTVSDSITVSCRDGAEPGFYAPLTHGFRVVRNAE